MHTELTSFLKVYQARFKRTVRDISQVLLCFGAVRRSQGTKSYNPQTHKQKSPIPGSVRKP